MGVCVCVSEGAQVCVTMCECVCECVCACTRTYGGVCVRMHGCV